MKLTCILLLTLTLAACEKNPPPVEEPNEKPTNEKKVESWRVVAEAELNDAQKMQHQKATAAQSALAQQLVQTLMAAIQTGGPTNGVTACKSNASAMVTSIANEHHVKIGRTSHKLRNGSNSAPKWMESINDGQHKETTIFAGPKGELGYASPIIMGDLCTKCHGTDEQLAEGISDILATHYPDDKARGFAPGDMRGWFWVEVAAQVR